jgi:hypothetical protein
MIRFASDPKSPLANVKDPYRILETHVPLGDLTPQQFLQALDDLIQGVDLARKHLPSGPG